MNKGVFRLVFNKRLGAYVPAHELAHATSSAGRSNRARKRLLAAMLAAMAPAMALADAGLVPFASSGLIPGSSAWSNASITAVTPTITTIQQTAPQAIANWAQFNLAREHTLNINQQANWQMLHRIADANPSVIAGTINAAGTNYFVNTNGIIFANGAQINVGSLMAVTSSSMDDAMFTRGLLSNLGQLPVFSNTGGFVKVEAGATLNAATGGRVMLLAKDVENHGVINTPDGQTILAAGEQIYLKSSTDPAGLIVEVNAGGTAANLGTIVADRGNVTLVGLAVNQQGRISASTSVRANGSIRLLARDTISAQQNSSGGYNYVPMRYGTVTIGQNSVTEVKVETADPEQVLASQALAPSRIDIEGRSVEVNGLLRAKGGQVNIAAKSGDESGQGVTTPVRVLLDKNAHIDVSGVDTKSAMEKNQLEVRLFSEQLKDTPILRGGALFGETVYLDARKGTDLFDVAPLLALRSQTIAERMSAGGTVNITSAGDVISKQGSVIDVSGGIIDYAAGYIRESQLLYQGSTVAISMANRETAYDGLTDVWKYTDPKWGWTDRKLLTPNDKGVWQQAYREGQDAGTVNITSVSPVILDGDLQANTRYDVTQRFIPPDGGKFNLTVTGGSNLNIVANAPVSATNVSIDSTNPASSTQLSTKLLSKGFNHLSVNNMGRIDVDTAVVTTGHGSVKLTGGNVNIKHDIITPGGDITVATQLNNESVVVADNVRLSTAGTWSNDMPRIPGALQTEVVLDGGNISLGASQNITLGQGSVLDASAGAWLDSTGQLQTGNGGDISLRATNVELGGSLNSYGFDRGGNLTIVTSQDVRVGGQQGNTGDFWLRESFFEQGGFSGYRISTARNGGKIVVGNESGAETVIHPKMQTLRMKSGYDVKQGGTSMSQIASREYLPEGVRTPTTLTFSAVGTDALSLADLTVLPNTIIRTDMANIAGRVGAITLEASRQLNVFGSLFSSAGTINLALKGAVDQLPYDNQQSIWLGENAVISTKGQYAPSVSTSLELRDARIMDGGDIIIDAEKGFVVAKEGSLLDVSGVSGSVDINTGRDVQRQQLDGAAGSISISAREGMILDGEFLASANGNGAGGTLKLALQGDLTPSSQTPSPPIGERVLTVTTNKQVQGSSLAPRDSLASLEGKAQISTDQINRGQFDHVSLESTTADRLPTATQRDRIVLESGVKLAAPETLALSSSAFEVSGNGHAEINASHVSLITAEANQTVRTGDATLQVNADWIDLNGQINISGVKETTLNSRLDIRGRGIAFGNAGSLRSNGVMNLIARQIYPVSNSSFDIEALGSNSEIVVKSSGEAYKPVFSAGGKLGLKATNIRQEGVLLAPLGQISLQATDKVSLGAGSLTSVSAAGLSIPYGTTQQGGTTWVLPNGLGNTPADKRISYSGKQVEMNSGAVVDISGNGNTFAYEWIQGIGGSTDLLSQAGVYAVLPGMQGEYAPFDYDYTKSNAPEIGKAVYLSNVAGLADGYYTLLPAHYALLEGAFMVQTSSQTVLPGGGGLLHDGSSLTSGFFTNVNQSSRDPHWQTFRVTNGNVFRAPATSSSFAPAEYMITSGNSYFAEKAATAGLAIPRTAADAGQLVLNASESLTLNATLNTSKAAAARGAMVDIVSDKISVVSQVGASDGTLQITSGSLSALNAESILLGGARTQGEEAVQITTTAREVSFRNDEQHALRVNQLIATATDSVTVESGAVIEAVQDSNQGSTNIRVNGDGALLAVSGNSDLVFDRTNPANQAGELNVKQGSKVTAARSLVLDASAVSTLAGQVGVGDGGSVTLGASSIVLGNPLSNVTGMRVDNALLDSLGNLRQVTLNSHGNLDLYGAVDFGSENLNVTINAAGLVGHELATSGESRLTANQLVLKNSAGAALDPSAAASSGKLAINANQFSVEGRNAAASNQPAQAGNFSIAGFEEVQLNSAGDFKFSGTGQLNIEAANSSISSSRITAATGTNYTAVATGSLQTSANGNAAQAAIAGLGAKLNLVASSLNLGGNVDLASGQFSARSTQGNLNVTSDARINTASRKIAFEQFNAHTPGGVISLQADQSNITVASGASLDVSGGEGGNAGTLKLSASQGEVQIADGTLHGQAAAGKNAGAVQVDVGTLADFSSLNQALNQGGFSYSREMRVRNGDVQIAAADVVQAGDFILSADSGKVEIAGKVDASGKNGGSIQVYAKQDIQLAAGSQLLAKGDAVSGSGGKVLLSSDRGNIQATVFEADGVTRRADAALIDVGGHKRGEVIMRAARVGTSGLLVDRAAPAAIAGADRIVLESLKVTDTAGTLTTATLNNIRTETNAFYQDVNNTVGNYLASSDGVSAIVAPHTELRINGDATLQNDWNLRDLSLGRDGVLTIRSTGNLQLNGSLSDGFNGVLAASTLAANNSWDINLVSGADMSAVNSLATIKNTNGGNMTLAANKLVRTGTGDINIAAGGNLTLSNAASVIYTAGQAADNLPGFLAASNADGFGANGAQFLINGGDLNINAQGNITGSLLAPTSGTQQLVNNWLFRQAGGTGNRHTSWWLRTDLFQQGVAAFGGGDVAIKSGGNIKYLSASTPTTGRYAGIGTGDSSILGGGDLSVIADGDITSGVYFVGKGQLDLQAGGQINRSPDLNAQGNLLTFGTTLALQDAKANVSAVNGAYIEAVFNPTLFAQATQNSPTGSLNQNGRSAFFNTYAELAAVDISSLTGAITFGLDRVTNISSKMSGLSTVNTSENNLTFYPGSVKAVAFSGDINVGQMKLMPSSQGNLSLLAGGNIIADQITMSDADASVIPTVSSPITLAINLNSILTSNHALIPLHANNTTPVSIVAREGSITPWLNPTTVLNLPKSAVIIAKQDIRNLEANLQHLSAGDLSIVKAGRDLTYLNGTQAGGINISGPGNLLVEAGRTFDLGASNGINSLANTSNAALPETGASVLVLAGTGRNASLQDYINLYINPEGSGPSVLQGNAEDLAAYRSSTSQALTAYMRSILGNQNLSEADAMTRFLALDQDRQSVFVYRHFSSELLASGKAFAELGHHERGDTAIATLWQGGNYKGDLNLFESRIRTVRDGSIDLLAPGGLINVGVAGGEGGGNIGIVTEQGGDIRAYADTGFQVNQSRVITQFGSDITVWVNNGDIDAGRGSKTALSMPEVEISTDIYGNTTRRIKGAAAGSGIQAQSYDPDGWLGPLQEPARGSVALLAPRGVLNLNEAGVVAGNFLTDAPIIGMGGLTVMGSSQGVAAVPTTTLAGANVASSSAGASAMNAATDLSRLAPAQDFMPKNLMPSFVSVEILSLGDILR